MRRSDRPRTNSGIPIEAAPDAMLMIDAAGRIVATNTLLGALFGYGAEELIGRSVEQILPLARSKGIGAEGLVGRRKDGSEFPAQIRSSSLTTSDGRFDVASVRDATSLLQAEVAAQAGEARSRRAETALSELDAFLDSIIENIPLMVFVKDAEELRFERFNRAGEELLGVKREMLLGKSDFDLFPAAQASFFQAKDRETLRQGGVVEILEEPIQTPRGERWLHTRKVVVLEQGAPKYLLGISEDVTERRRLSEELQAVHQDLERKVRERTADLLRVNEELRRAQEQRDDIQRAVSHDLRSPLAVIHLQAQRLVRLCGEPDAQKALRAILTSTGRMEAMIGDLVEAARLEGGQLEKRRVELASFFRELLARTAGVLDVRRVELEVLDEDLAVLADPSGLERVVTNLLSNALKYSPHDSVVRLRAERTREPSNAGDEVVVTVSDHGVGIAEDDVPHLFQRFWRSKATSRAEGLGLGLFITKQIVSAHGGRIWVDSAMGEGSRFCFSLPIATA